MEGDPRRNSSSDMMNAAQVCISAIRMTLQETPTIGTCLTNIPESRKPKKYLRECCHHRIKCTAATFLAAFMWRIPLNSATLATTTHNKLERMSNGTGTQVRVRMINRWRVKMIQMRIYKGKTLQKKMKKKRKHGSNLNCLCI